MIPKKLHIPWIGPEGSRPDAAIDTWRRANPEWEIKVWGNEDLSAGDWHNRDHMRDMLAHDLGAVMTMMRYEILVQEGGVAVDALSMARQPLDDWLRCEDFACWADEHALPGVLAEGFLGAEPGSPFFKRVIDDIRLWDSLVGRSADDTVGAVRLTRTWRAMEYPLTVFPAHFFAPTFEGTCAYTGEGIIYGERLYVTPDEIQDPDIIDAVVVSD